MDLIALWRASYQGSNLALIASDRAVTHAALDEAVGHIAQLVTQGSGLVVLVTTNTIDSVVIYLACLAAGRTVLLLEGAGSALALLQSYPACDVFMPKALSELLAPNAIPAEFAALGSIPDYHLYQYSERAPLPTHLHLDLLLTTSGSTGSPKLARLSADNVASNASSIANYLGLQTDDIGMLAMPMNYSYGLSVLNSHLVRGAAVALPAQSFLRAETWDFARANNITSFAGVPFMYEALAKVRFSFENVPGIRTLTQAGGALASELTQRFAEPLHARGGRFYSMYGQTEATARMAYVPPENLFTKLGSIGIAIPDGELRLGARIQNTNAFELIYRGPNVMMGYAETPDDLLRDNDLQGELYTGDLATRDDDGFFYIRGRLKRFAKIHGKRIGLDDVERLAHLYINALHATSFTSVSDLPTLELVVIERKNQLTLIVDTATFQTLGDVGVLRKHLCDTLLVPAQSVQVEHLDALPRLANQKIDYQALVSLAR